MMAEVPPEPIIVYRGRSLAEAQDLASYLREHGVDARLVEGDPLGHAHPAADFFHDVIVNAVETEQLRSLIHGWMSGETAEGNRLNPYTPPATESARTDHAKTSLSPTDGIWLHPLEKQVSIISGLMVLAAIMGALLVAWQTWIR